MSAMNFRQKALAREMFAAGVMIEKIEREFGLYPGHPNLRKTLGLPRPKPVERGCPHGTRRKLKALSRQWQEKTGSAVVVDGRSG